MVSDVLAPPSSLLNLSDIHKTKEAAGEGQDTRAQISMVRKYTMDVSLRIRGREEKRGDEEKREERRRDEKRK